ncbi:type VI secretion system baseplate subunit TssF [Aquisalimonas asiatica]|uniref:Type VI secretion system protein ImpG n=1 Tax=Aquisalimonas asiatica TaxID=406100 RepID=A0A1H8UIZ2_9GAMM|nr:type VI secretion system baseplate subunit TssF [Aquisalimonas asiatica]SEP03190.1 type VI secretion system protein ImpG [Aquisalimonas asiatica]
MDMKREFDLEMQRLAESGRAFAHANPEQARMLNLDEVHDRDPYVERLLEGVAYLTAGVRHEIDASLTDFHDQLLACAAPELAEPFASTTVLEFRVHDGEQGVVTLPAGARAESQPVGDTRVRVPFATLFDTVVRPLRVGGAVWVDTGEGRSELRFSLHADGVETLPSLDALDLFIDAEPALAHALRYALTGRVSTVEARLRDEAPWHRVGGAEAVAPCYPARRAERVNGTIPGSPALERLQHFFMARETLHCIRLTGLDTLHPDDDCDRIDVRVRVETTPPASAEGRERLVRCNCVPAVNLVRGDSDPLRLDHRTAECMVKSGADGVDARVVHQVIAAVGRSVDRRVVAPFVPLWEWDFAPGKQRLFRTKRRDTGTGTPALSVVLEDDGAAGLETVSTDILYSHGAIPRLHLSKGDVSQPAPDLPDGIGVTSLRRPTPYRAPPARDPAFQALTALARTDLEGLAAGPAIRALLAGLDRTEGADARARVEAVTDVTCSATGRLRRGVLEQGLEIRVSVDERRLLNVGEAALLGELLHGLFQEWAPVDRYVTTRVAVEPRGEETVWTTQ